MKSFEEVEQAIIKWLKTPLILPSPEKRKKVLKKQKELIEEQKKSIKQTENSFKNNLQFKEIYETIYRINIACF